MVSTPILQLILMVLTVRMVYMIQKIPFLDVLVLMNSENQRHIMVGIVMFQTLNFVILINLK